MATKRKHEKFYLWFGVISFCFIWTFTGGDPLGYYISLIALVAFIFNIVFYKRSPKITISDPEIKPKPQDFKLTRSKGDLAGLGSLVVIALVVWGILSLFGFNYHGTSEGTVKYDDCREIIYLQPDDWQTYFGTFTGYSIKTNSGKVMGGQFVRIENDSSLFVSGSTCARAYIYTKQQDNVCTDPAYPYLTYNDRCAKTQFQQ